jgi:ribosomal protein S14
MQWSRTRLDTAFSLAGKGSVSSLPPMRPCEHGRYARASDRLFRPDATPPSRMKSPVYNSSEQRRCGYATMFLHRIDLNVSRFRQIALNDDVLGAYRELF